MTPDQIQRNAVALRNAGLPDAANRWLGMTPEAWEQNAKTVTSIMESRHGGGTMTKPGPKEARAAASPPPVKTYASIDVADAAAIAAADSFTVSIYHGGAYNKLENLPSIAEARRQGGLLREQIGAQRDFLVYAILKDGRSLPVPRSYPSAPVQETTMAKTATTKKTASTTTAKKPTAKAKPTPAVAPKKADAAKARDNARTPVKGKPSKSDLVDTMLKANGGATKEALSKATGWPSVNLKVAATRAKLVLAQNGDNYALLPAVKEPWKGVFDGATGKPL